MTTRFFIGGSGRSGTTVVGETVARLLDLPLSPRSELRGLTGRGGLLELLFGIKSGKSNRSASWDLFGVRIKVSKSFPFVSAKTLSRVRTETLLMVSEWKWFRLNRHNQSEFPYEEFNVKENDFKKSLEEFKKALTTDRISACANFIDSLFQYSQREFHGWVDTTPPNIRFAKEISLLYPDAKFIHVIRDGRDVAASISNRHEIQTSNTSTSPWPSRDLFENLLWWFDQTQLALKTSLQMNYRNIYTIFLSDLAQKDIEQQKRAHINFLEFIGVSASPNNLSLMEETLFEEKSSLGHYKKLIDEILLDKFESEYKQYVEILSKQFKIKFSQFYAS